MEKANGHSSAKNSPKGGHPNGNNKQKKKAGKKSPNYQQRNRSHSTGEQSNSSYSPKMNNYHQRNRSHSPKPNNFKQHQQRNRSHSPKNGKQNQQRNRSHSPKMQKPKNPSEMTVIINRVDLHDSAANIQPLEDQQQPHLHHHNSCPVLPYHYAPDKARWMKRQEQQKKAAAAFMNQQMIHQNRRMNPAMNPHMMHQQHQQNPHMLPQQQQLNPHIVQQQQQNAHMLLQQQQRQPPHMLQQQQQNPHMLQPQRQNQPMPPLLSPHMLQQQQQQNQPMSHLLNPLMLQQQNQNQQMPPLLNPGMPQQQHQNLQMPPLLNPNMLQQQDNPQISCSTNQHTVQHLHEQSGGMNPNANQQQQKQTPNGAPLSGGSPPPSSVAVARVPYAVKFGPNLNHDHCDPVMDTSIPNPFDPSIDKYWAQRRRLFSRFDHGIKLDSEGWYSVTPEIIADHVANRVADMAKHHISMFNPGGRGFILLDAFCGCGGNSIAFGKIPPHLISLVVCVDTDRNKLRMAAHNASIYKIPTNKLVFVECNSTWILKHCYRNGLFVLDKPIECGEDEFGPTREAPMQLPNPVPTENYAGYQIGGINMLPRFIDMVFMDPPWGGVDYEVLGKNGYDLTKNMKIPCNTSLAPTAEQLQQEKEKEEAAADRNVLSDDFFDSFVSKPMSVKEKKATFNKSDAHDENNYVNGTDLLITAAAATGTRLVLYDLPRNTSKQSLGQSALAAGYRGNCKLEEHYLNGRLKTVTAYFGADHSSLLHPNNHPNHHHKNHPKHHPNNHPDLLPNGHPNSHLNSHPSGHSNNHLNHPPNNRQ